MSDHKSPPEFDDELLSAYLDDELAPEERARVEERLAADPAAQKMLEQLRAASQTMQGLPREAVGEDLRPAILQQAERAMLTSGTTFPRLAEGPDSRPSPAALADDSLPPFSIGRTRRGWFWAGLAVAAALLVAFIQSDEPDSDLPDVARRANLRRDDDRSGSVERRTEDDRSALAVESAEPVPQLGDELADRRAVDDVELRLGMPVAGTEPEPAAPTTAMARNRTAEDAAAEDAPAHSVDALAERYAVAPRSTAAGRRGESVQPQVPIEDGAAGAAMEGETGTALSQEEPLVVHVNIKPVAFRNKAFERVLLMNGIAVEPEPAGAVEPIPAGAANRYAENETLETAEGRANSQAQTQNDRSRVELVLVEAPQEQILATLKTLNDDRASYSAVEIEDPPATSPFNAAKNLAVENNWGVQFNRGSVPLEQKQQYRDDVRFYYQSDQSDVAAAGDAAVETLRSKAGVYGGYGGNAASAGRARRIQLPAQSARADAQRQIGRGLEATDPSASESKQFGTLRQAPVEGKAAATKDGDPLQVLFVLSSETSEAPSPPANDPTQ